MSLDLELSVFPFTGRPDLAFMMLCSLLQSFRRRLKSYQTELDLIIIDVVNNGRAKWEKCVPTKIIAVEKNACVFH